jgi:hypothetical protein
MTCWHMSLGDTSQQADVWNAFDNVNGIVIHRRLYVMHQGRTAAIFLVFHGLDIRPRRTTHGLLRLMVFTGTGFRGVSEMLEEARLFPRR